MASSCTNAMSFLLLLYLFFVSSVPTSRAQARTLLNQEGSNYSFSALLVFGDSTVDPGNNNYISTPFRSNFPPYGRDFPNQMSTGRFSNGKLIPDLIASQMGIKEYVPPYLDKTLSLEELMTGVSFASAASGYDPLTPRISGVIPIQKQLEYFREYKAMLEIAIGKKRTENQIKRAVFLVSAGTNDFVVNYFSIPIRRQRYTLVNYQQFLIQNARDFLQGLWDLGARKIAVVGLPPMGCLPIVITLNSRNTLERSCIDSYSTTAKEYNQKLQHELEVMQKIFANYGTRILYVGIYQPLLDLIQSPDKFGFEDTGSGCCGTGLFETTFLCNSKSSVCPDASKYVFWDSIHPTEKAYSKIFEAVHYILDLFVEH